MDWQFTEKQKISKLDGCRQSFSHRRVSLLKVKIRYLEIFPIRNKIFLAESSFPKKRDIPYVFSLDRVFWKISFAEYGTPPYAPLAQLVAAIAC